MGSFANSGQTPLSVSQVALSESAKVKPTRLHFPIIVVAKIVFMFRKLGRVFGPSLSTPRGQPLFIIHMLNILINPYQKLIFIILWILWRL